MAHEREAFIEQLYLQYHDNMVWRCLYYTGYRPEYAAIAEDCVQEAFLRVLKRYETIKTYENPGGYLWTCCLNELKSQLRKQGRTLPLDVPDGRELPDPLDCIARWEEQTQHREQLEAVHAVLTERERRVCAIYFGEEASMQETARQTGHSVSAVKAMLFRIRRRVRSQSAKE